jgi:hypothetical protein
MEKTMVIEHTNIGEINGVIVGEYSHKGIDFVQIELLSKIRTCVDGSEKNSQNQKCLVKGAIFDIAKNNIERIAV